MTDTTKQTIRNNALAAEFEALRAQAAAIHALDNEHTFGLENTWDCNRVVTEVEALIHRCQLLEPALPTLGDTVAAVIEEFKTAAETAKVHARTFDAHAETGAEKRKETALTPELSAESEPATALATGAAESCLKAETRMYESFALQVSAILNLCMEILYNAAGKSDEAEKE